MAAQALENRGRAGQEVRLRQVARAKQIVGYSPEKLKQLLEVKAKDARYKEVVVSTQRNKFTLKREIVLTGEEDFDLVALLMQSRS